MKDFKFNTSNKGKQSEISQFFKERDDLIEIEFTNINLEEPDTQDQDIIVAYKASKLPSTFIEDSALFIENVDEAGTNVKWIEQDLDKHANKKAKFVTLFGYYDGEKVYIFEGMINGTICTTVPGTGFGFDKNFIPEGSEVPYSVSKPLELTPRFLALSKILEGQCSRVVFPTEWKGKMQNE